MWVALLILFILLGILAATIGGVWYYIHNDKLKLKWQLAQAQAATLRAELAAKQAAQSSGLTLAKTRQEELHQEARVATNLLSTLLLESTQLRKEANALKANEAGKQVALFPELVELARRFYQANLNDIPLRETIVTKLEGARRFELQRIEVAGTSYEPTPEIQTAVQSLKAWGEENLAKTKDARQIFSSLITESKIKVTDTRLTSDSITLAEAMDKLALAEAQTIERLRLGQSGSAKLDAAKIAAEAEAKGILSQAERLRNETFAKAREEADEQSRELALRDAESKIKDTKTKVAVEEAEDQKRNIQLRKKASDPKIQVKLAPFLTPGYAQI